MPARELLQRFEAFTGQRVGSVQRQSAVPLPDFLQRGEQLSCPVEMAVVAQHGLDRGSVSSPFLPAAETELRKTTDLPEQAITDQLITETTDGDHQQHQEKSL